MSHAPRVPAPPGYFGKTMTLYQWMADRIAADRGATIINRVPAIPLPGARPIGNAVEHAFQRSADRSPQLPKAQPNPNNAP